MKCFRVLLASALLGSIIAGCSGPAIEEGMAKGEPDEVFKNALKTQGNLMQTNKLGQKAAEAKVKGLEQPKSPP